MISAVNRRGRMRFMIEKKGLNADVICRFLDRLIAGSETPVFLVWDGHPVHKSNKVTEKVRSYKGKLRLYLLPSYSPKLNPGEGVWREAKSHRLGRAGIFSFAEMKSKALGALRCLLNRPEIIRTFFHTPSTLYAS
jgi:transposase